MNIVIADAGKIGQLLAEKLSVNGHNVVLMDSSEKFLKQISKTLDIRVVEGSCISLETLKQAHAGEADVMLAVGADDASNILACQLANRLGASKTICSISNKSFFSVLDNITPESMGIWKYVSPQDECVRKITAVVKNSSMLEEIRFSHPDAVMRILEIKSSSMLSGMRIKDISPDISMLPQIRFAALIRNQQIIIPHGDTIFVPGDKIYIAGRLEYVRSFMQWESSNRHEETHSRIIIAGASDIAALLAQALCPDYEIRIIEKNQTLAEKISDSVSSNVLVINGDPTDESVQEEAGIFHCAAFISVAEDDEENILSCIMAKKLGAAKTISVTRKPEYISMVPVMKMIDCGISASLVAINAILRLLETGTMRIDAYLQMVHAQLAEFRIIKSSPLCGKTLVSCKIPSSAILALLFRGDEVIAPSGSTVFQAGDIVVCIVTRNSVKEIESLFPER